jgi:hypothetical protein
LSSIYSDIGSLGGGVKVGRDFAGWLASPIARVYAARRTRSGAALALGFIGSPKSLKLARCA